MTALRLISRASSGTGVTGAGRFTQRKPKLLRVSVGALPDTGIIKLGKTYYYLIIGENLLLEISSTGTDLKRQKNRDHT